MAKKMRAGVRVSSTRPSAGSTAARTRVKRGTKSDRLAGQFASGEQRARKCLDACMRDPFNRGYFLGRAHAFSEATHLVRQAARS